MTQKLFKSLSIATLVALALMTVDLAAGVEATRTDDIDPRSTEPVVTSVADATEVVVILNEPPSIALLARFQAEGVEVLRVFDRLEQVVVLATPKHVAKLEAFPAVVAVGPNAAVSSSGKKKKKKKSQKQEPMPEGEANADAPDGTGPSPELMPDTSTDVTPPPAVAVGNDEALAGRGVRIAVLDSGIHPHHKDIAGRVIEAVNFSTESAELYNMFWWLQIGRVMDTWGHGTCRSSPGTGRPRMGLAGRLS